MAPRGTSHEQQALRGMFGDYSRHCHRLLTVPFLHCTVHPCTIHPRSILSLALWTTCQAPLPRATLGFPPACP